MTNKRKGIGIHLAAFLIGRVAVGTMYPFLVAFFLASYLEGVSSAGMFVCLMLGVVSTLQFGSVIQYSVVIFVLAMMLTCIQDRHVADNRIVIALMGAGVAFVAEGVRLLVAGQLLQMPYMPFLEAVLVAGSVIVYQTAIFALTGQPWNLLERNEAVVGSIALFATMVAGLPVTVAGQFSILALTGILAAMYGSYIYGIAAGTTLGTVCGIVLAWKTGQIEHLACLALVGLVAGVASQMGRIATLLGVGAVYAVLGWTYQQTFVEPQMVRALASALLVFGLTPKGVLYRQAYKGSPAALDMSIQKNVLDDFGNQLREYGQAFEQVSENFMSYNQTPEQSVVFRQMENLGSMISDYADHLQIETGFTKQQEHKLKTVLWSRSILLGKMMAYKGPGGRQRIYLYASRTKGNVTTAREIARLVSGIMNKQFAVDEGSRSIVGECESLIVLVEAPNFTYQSGYICHRKRGESVCGDYSYLAPVGKESMLLMISDGMGSGEPAFRQSEFLTESIADLIGAGFDQSCSIGLVNSMMSMKCQGENFATLDLCHVDLYSGMAEFIKYGAAATFIKRDQWIDTIMSTSLPLGAVSDAKGDVTMKKLFVEDVVVMCSDGLMECIDEEDKIACMKEYLCELESDTPEEIASELYRRIIQHRPENERELTDDATLVVFRLKQAA